MVIAHPGQDVELSCDVDTSGSETIAWIINHEGIYTLQELLNGIVAGYSSNGNNLIIENIMMNDDRNMTEHQCATVSSQTPMFSNIENTSDITILYIAGEYTLVALHA